MLDCSNSRRPRFGFCDRRWIKTHVFHPADAVVDVDESESAESFELPGADLSGEELSVRVIPKQADEFTCSSCFLVHHRSRLADALSGYGTSVERAAVTAVRGGVLASLVGAQSSEDWLSTLATIATIGGFGLSVWWLWKNGDLEGLV